MEHVKLAVLEAAKHLENIVWNEWKHGGPDRQRCAAMLAMMKTEGMSWPVDKLNRWFGFVQGVLFVYNFLDIIEERDRTRPIFHAAYEREGLPVPESVSVEKVC